MKKLSIKGVALTLGLCWGLLLGLWTLVCVWTGYGKEMLDLMATVYPYYEVSYVGAGIGAVIGFFDAAIGGALLTFIYNKLA